MSCRRPPLQFEPFVIELDSDSDFEDFEEDDASSHCSSQYTSLRDIPEDKEGSLFGYESRARTMLDSFVENVKIAIEQKNEVERSDWERQTIDHLHNNAVTVTDVELLIPALNDCYAVTNKLATNIGLFRSRDLISESDLEAMLTHILAQGDLNNIVYERVHDQIARFKREKEERKDQKRSFQQRRYHELHAKNEREKAGRVVAKFERQEAREVARRVKTFPAQWRRQVANDQFLPIGINSVAEVFADFLRMDYSDVLQYTTAPKQSNKEPTNEAIREQYYEQHEKRCSHDELLSGWMDLKRIARMQKLCTEDILLELEERLLQCVFCDIGAKPVTINPHAVAPSDHLFDDEDQLRPNVRIPVPRPDQPLPPLPFPRAPEFLSRRKKPRPTIEEQAWPKTRGSCNHFFALPKGQVAQVKLPKPPAPVQRKKYEHLIAIPRCFGKSISGPQDVLKTPR